MTVPKVGDVVAWADVPDGAMVRDRAGDYAVRRKRGAASWGSWVKVGGEPWLEWAGAWRWRIHEVYYTIIALGLTGQETAEDLRRLSEVYEIRGLVPIDIIDGIRKIGGDDLLQSSLDMMRQRMLSAGWRPGMTAEAAARLLAAAGK
jgi:hypothetical protein